MKVPRDAYKVLQVDHEADPEVIQAAYRRLARKYHPDLSASGADDEAAVRMVEINAAWDVLRDPGRRREYDLKRRPGTTHARSHGSGHSHAATAASSAGGGHGHSSHGHGSVGPPPGPPSGSVLNFGRYSGWSLGEIGRVDPGYLEWLDRMPIGRPLRGELDALLRKLGRPR
jgi:curved DNA-binding protein